MRIAALDDDPILLELLKAMTESLGHVCHTFDTGAALLKTLRRDSFDLLIVDWHLPDMDGPEVVCAPHGRSLDRKFRFCSSHAAKTSKTLSKHWPAEPTTL